MPFEIAPKEQTAAQKLAALIETGRACFPDMEHIRKAWGDGDKYGCAMTFAMRAAGVGAVSLFEEDLAVNRLADHLGVDRVEMSELAKRVIHANDAVRMGLDEIATALRSDTLPIRTFAHVKPVFGKSIIGEGAYFTVSYVGDAIHFDSAILKLKASVKPATPAKKTRQSAKTGATWPVPKHCYA